MKKSLTKQLKEAKEKIKDLESKLKEVEDDRTQYRNWMVQDLNQLIKMAGANEYWSAAYLIERTTKRLQKVKWFYW